MIYSPRAQPEVNKSHIHEVPQNNWLIFHMGEVSHGQGINRDMTLVVVLSHFVSSNNRQVDHQNTQFNVEEATEGLFSFDHSDEHREVSIGSVEKETKANKKKALKRDVIVVDDKEFAGQEQ